MQECYFPFVMYIVNGKLSHYSSYGTGHITPELAHNEGQHLSPEPIQLDTDIIVRKYQNKVQSFWVPIK